MTSTLAHVAMTGAPRTQRSGGADVVRDRPAHDPPGPQVDPAGPWTTCARSAAATSPTGPPRPLRRHPSTNHRVRAQLRDHFTARTRADVEIPHDPLMADGKHLDLGAFCPATREAWLTATAALTAGLTR